MKPTQALEFVAPRDDNARLANLCGPLDENLRQIEQALDVTLSRRGHRIAIRGRGAKLALAALENFYNRARDALSVDDIQLALVEVRHTSGNGRQDTLDVRFRGDPDHPFDEPVVQLDASEPDEEPAPKLYTRRADLRGRTPAQREYLKQILSHDVTFGIGPAGTGKTYLAIAKAVEALEAGKIERIMLSRPAVEAGESLGYLPGDLEEKLAPYLRPLYDALSDRLGRKRLKTMLGDGSIEIAPVGYMRGRTLNNAFVVIDEAQNCTYTQIKMLLTRLGWHSTMVLTGDPDQTDLLPGMSGLSDIANKLETLPDVAVVRLQDRDIVRHPLVASMLTVL